MLFHPSTDQVRRFFCTAWARHCAGEPLEAMQALAAAWCERHPEYSAILAEPDTAIARTFAPESGQENPFLHLSLHLAIEEQIGADQPPGVRAAWEALCRRWGDTHKAAHEAMECLGPVLWEAQRAQRLPDTLAYLTCLRRRAALR